MKPAKLKGPEEMKLKRSRSCEIGLDALGSTKLKKAEVELEGLKFQRCW